MGQSQSSIAGKKECNGSTGTLYVDDIEEDSIGRNTPPCVRHASGEDGGTVSEYEADDLSASCASNVFVAVLQNATTRHAQEENDGDHQAVSTGETGTMPSLAAIASSFRGLFVLLQASTLIVLICVVTLLLPLIAACRNEHGDCNRKMFRAPVAVSTLNPREPLSNRKLKRVESLDELYEAVDAYLLLRYGGGNNTEVLERYGDPIGSWDVANVNSFARVFDAQNRTPRAKLFDEDLQGWDVSNAASLEAMFRSAEKLTGQGVEGWNTAKVTNLEQVFTGCTAFNGNVSSWNVSSVLTMERAFANCPVFDCDLDGWDVANTQSFDQMFLSAHKFNRDLSTWNTTSLLSMQGMFQDAYSFNGDVSSLDVSRVKNFSNVFAYSSSFNGDLAKWNLSSALTISQMFYFAQRFTGDAIADWDVSNVEDSSFALTTSDFAGDISSWNLTSLIDGTGLFAGLLDFPNEFCMSEISFHSLFLNTSDLFLDDNICVLPEDKRNTTESAGVECKSCGDGTASEGDAPASCSHLSSFQAFRTKDELVDAVDAYLLGESAPSDVIDIYGHIEAWNVTNIENFSHLFDGYRNVNAMRFNGNLECWNTSNARSTEAMFRRAYSFSGNLSSWDVSRVVTMKAMFAESVKFNGDISAWRTGNVRDFSSMFAFQRSFNADIGSWDVSNARDISTMFRGTSSFNRDLSFWNVTQVDIARDVFGGARAFNQNLCPWKSRLQTTVETMNIFTASACLAPASTRESLGASFCHPCSLRYNDTSPIPCGGN